MAVDRSVLAEELAGLDALDVALGRRPPRARRVWAQLWPKAAAIVLAVGAWQLVVWSGWRDEYVLPGPGTVLGELADLSSDAVFWKAIRITMQRAAIGYALAVVIGSLVGLAVSRLRPLRVAVGSLITGLQTMPSVAWFPLAIVLFKLSESAILFVVVLGAAPAIANGLIAGVDHVPPLLLRAGRVVGARGVALYRHVVLPAALPGFVAGLKQAWAFAWRSLMAGELIAVVAERPSIGQRLTYSRELSDTAGLMAWMIVILVIGIAVDAAFGRGDAVLRRRRGLVDAAVA